MSSEPRKPTTQEYALAAFADHCEGPDGIKTSAYYRLTEQIDSARSTIAAWEKVNPAK